MHLLHIHLLQINVLDPQPRPRLFILPPPRLHLRLLPPLVPQLHLLSERLLPSQANKLQILIRLPPTPNTHHHQDQYHRGVSQSVEPSGMNKDIAGVY